MPDETHTGLEQGSGSRRCQLLLVDDNPSNLQVLSKALEAQDSELLIALNGEDALEIAAEAKPELILLDINMPGMDGFETCRRLKANPDTRDCVVIFLSARDALADKVEGFRLGAVDYISKPFQFEEVIARLNTHLALRRAQEDLALMHRRADTLLNNILPESIANRLKQEESNPVDYFPEATILFCDLVGFTSLSAENEPAEVVGFLNRVFTAIDTLVDRHGLEKIKTIGDAYMLSGGVPDRRPDHAQAVAAFALDLQEILPSLREAEPFPLHLRIGIHSGPVVAGVIGKKRFAYDLWGDTVNTASRMESNGVRDRIHISRETRELLGPEWQTEAREPITIKGKGLMTTFFLNGRLRSP